MKLQTIKDGYQRITLGAGENKKSYLIQRLVAETFIPNPDNLPEVHHTVLKKTKTSCMHVYETRAYVMAFYSGEPLDRCLVTQFSREQCNHVRTCFDHVYT